jgi:hypothetical protein
VLAITAGIAFVCDSSPHYGVLNVAAQASPASANKTVTNNLTVVPGSISLGSTLHATGKVTAAQKPLANASVALHLGDVKLAYAQTNANGDYSFAAPVGVYYFPAAFSNGATVYTVVEPGDASFTSTPSAVTSVSVDLLPLYVLIVVITAVIVIGLYVYTQRLRGKGVFGSRGRGRAKPVAEQTVTVAAEASLSETRALDQEQRAEEITSATDIIAEEPLQEAPEFEPPSPAETTGPLAHETPSEPKQTSPASVAETGVLKQADDFFERGNDRQGVNELYDAAVRALVTRHELTIASNATHWEKYYAIEAAVPGVQEPLRTLTVVYERVNYAGKALTDEQRKAAVAAFRAITVHVESVKGSA